MLNPKLTYHVIGIKSDSTATLDNFKEIAYGYSDTSGALSDYSKIKNALCSDMSLDTDSIKEQGPFAFIKKMVGNMFGLKT